MLTVQRNRQGYMHQSIKPALESNLCTYITTIEQFQCLKPIATVILAVPLPLECHTKYTQFRYFQHKRANFMIMTQVYTKHKFAAVVLWWYCVKQ